MSEGPSDVTMAGILLLVAMAIFACGVGMGKYNEHKKYQYGCSPDVLRSYTEGYYDCKAGK